LKNYEGALARYANFNDDHDSATSAQLDEARKAYVGMSSEHIFRINKLRHELGHFLIQQFSTATTSRKELFDDAQVWNQLDTMLFSWTKWLAEVGVYSFLSNFIPWY
jgi:Trk-type K+ transport system membrane component